MDSTRAAHATGAPAPRCGGVQSVNGVSRVHSARAPRLRCLDCPGPHMPRSCLRNGSRINNGGCAVASVCSAVIKHFLCVSGQKEISSWLNLHPLRCWQASSEDGNAERSSHSWFFNGLGCFFPFRVFLRAYLVRSHGPGIKQPSPTLTFFYLLL